MRTWYNDATIRWQMEREFTLTAIREDFYADGRYHGDGESWAEIDGNPHEWLEETIRVDRENSTDCQAGEYSIYKILDGEKVVRMRRVNW